MRDKYDYEHHQYDELSPSRGSPQSGRSRQTATCPHASRQTSVFDLRPGSACAGARQRDILPTTDVSEGATRCHDSRASPAPILRPGNRRPPVPDWRTQLALKKPACSPPTCRSPNMCCSARQASSRSALSSAPPPTPYGSTAAPPPPPT